MYCDHRADGSFVFHPDRGARSHKEAIALKTAELKGTPTLEPFGGLALGEAAHGLRVKGECFVWDDDPTAQKARHMEEVGRTVPIDLIPCPTDVPGHTLDIVVQQDIEILPHVAHL